MDLKGLKYLVVGAGLFGSTIAERIANDLNEKVLVIDKRDVVGGNCYCQCDTATGILYHTYGTHVFHTSNKNTWDYINKFSLFNNFQLQVLTRHIGKLYQMPINLHTINSFYSKSFRPYEAEKFLSTQIKKIDNPSNLEEKAISLIGEDLYKAFIKGYTKKQWRKNPNKLPASIITRLPFRFNYDNRYFNDMWQGVPVNGYNIMFDEMLKSENITVITGIDFFDDAVQNDIPEDCKIIYSGPIDRYFDYKLGRLEWRSLRFERKVFELDDYQGVAIVNYADEETQHTRIHEPKHLHPEFPYIKGRTVLFKEFPDDNDNEPYYPINDDNNTSLVLSYRKLIKENNTIFGGRLGEYKYFDMDETIERALSTYEHEIKERK